MAQALLKPLTEDDYLDAELRSEVRHEYMYGAIYAMAGGSANHSTIALNLASHCNLRGSGDCKTYSSDMKLRLDMGGLYYYPDVMLVCDASDDEQQFKSSPCMIAEVLSPSTESIDRREKWTAYQKLSSLREYILLAQDRPYIEVYKRVNFRQWGLTVLGAEDTLELSCMDLNIPLMDLYRGVDFSKAAKSP